jgi:hypothetical protein
MTTVAGGLIIHPAVKNIILVGTTFFALLAIGKLMSASHAFYHCCADSRLM